MDQKEKIRVMGRLHAVRTKLLFRYPFWGTLLLHLQLGLADCKTAYTDMRHLVFDPEFVSRLDDEQTAVVMMHEVMHCALSHCLRARNHYRYLYNIACDIVVNSMLLWTMGYCEFEVGGEMIPHLAPNGKEGRLYTAEEVYEMLLRGSGTTPGNGFVFEEGFGSGDSASDSGQGGKYVLIDRHDPWTRLEPESAESYEWQENIHGAKSHMAGDRVCLKAREIFEGYRKSKIDWKKELHDFLHQVLDKADYSFIPNDRRYSYTDLIIPMFHFEEEDSVGNIWFCVDASGSITKRELTVLFGEVRQALLQFRHFKGKVSFFDWDVTEPVEFESEEDLEKCRPAGGNLLVHEKTYDKRSPGGGRCDDRRVCGVSAGKRDAGNPRAVDYH